MQGVLKSTVPHTGVINALAAIPFALGIIITGHTLIAVLTIDTDRRLAGTAPVGQNFAGLAGPIYTGRRIVPTIVITATGNTADATRTEGCRCTAAGVIGHIAETTIAIHALPCTGGITIVIA